MGGPRWHDDEKMTMTRNRIRPVTMPIAMRAAWLVGRKTQHDLTRLHDGEFRLDALTTLSSNSSHLTVTSSSVFGRQLKTISFLTVSMLRAVTATLNQHSSENGILNKIKYTKCDRLQRFCS